ncbi:hypothetical protein TRICI_003394 [Trichomonascus ciferrii]|uniref:Uncharacterized protein n=1 Tax=Trichomonascus ciferrii TaxID=44093 RepID=A0A642V387_9ASCO|nr:hypothetical protein TRICI_003394 [Trichomonascus ciferrii]
MNQDELRRRLENELAYYESEIQIRVDLIRTTSRSALDHETAIKVHKYENEKRELQQRANETRNRLTSLIHSRR